MSTVAAIPFSEPVHYRTAVELSDMPLTEMLTQIERQERQFSREKSLGAEAREVLELLRGGYQVTVKRNPIRNSYWMGQRRIASHVIRQLVSRGYLSPADVFENAREVAES